MDKIRWFIIRFLWRFPYISRRWCWADAVAWAEGLTDEVHEAQHDCFYCLACNTDAEAKAYQVQPEAEYPKP
jgi:hypothetical protein